MKFLLGTKQNMTQIFKEDGTCIPVTVLSAGPMSVTQVKTEEKDGYRAVQVGYGTRNVRNINKSLKGHLKDAGPVRYLREVRVEEGEAAAVGDKIDVGIFEEGDSIEVSGISKGKGFQGVVKRHGFHGGPRSHGQKHSEREPGSIGATGPQRVFKGTRMGGRMGSDRTTIKGLKVVAIDKENNTLLVTGAVPGKRGTLIEIKG